MATAAKTTKSPAVEPVAETPAAVEPVAETPAVDWEALLDAAVIEEKRDRRTTPVEVPEKYMAFATMLHTTGKTATIAVDGAVQFDQLKGIFRAAADKLGASATVRGVNGDNDVITKLRVSIGARRGKKTPSAA